VHNGIEYGLMAAYAEGLNILRRANAGKERRAVDAETAPLLEPELYQYDMDLPEIAEVWRRGSVIASWLLDLTAAALVRNPALHAMIRYGALDVPVIGVARSKWTLDQLRARARDSIQHHGGFDPGAFDKLASLLRYASGDYGDPATFDGIGRELGGARRPLH